MAICRHANDQTSETEVSHHQPAQPGKLYCMTLSPNLVDFSKERLGQSSRFLQKNTASRTPRAPGLLRRPRELHLRRRGKCGGAGGAAAGGGGADLQAAGAGHRGVRAEQGCGIKGSIPTSVIQGNLPLYRGVLVFGKPFLLYHRSGHFPQPWC